MTVAMIDPLLSLDGTTAPASPGATPPELKTPETKPEPKPGEETPSTPPETSPPVEKPADPTPEAVAAEAARAAVHTEAAAYAVNLDADAKAALNMGDGEDPIVKGITEHFAKAGKTQGALDDFLAQAGDLAKAGLFDTGQFDPVAEAAKLGDNAEGRRREVEIFAEGLKARGDGFDDEMFGEMMSLSPTAAGVKLVEYMRRMAGPAADIDPPTTADPATARGTAVAAAEAQRRDPKYETDRAFRRAADAAFIAAHSNRG